MMTFSTLVLPGQGKPETSGLALGQWKKRGPHLHPPILGGSFLVMMKGAMILQRGGVHCSYLSTPTPTHSGDVYSVQSSVQRHSPFSQMYCIGWADGE